MNQINQPRSSHGSSNRDSTDSQVPSPDTSSYLNDLEPNQQPSNAATGIQACLNRKQANMFYVGICRLEEDVTGMGAWMEHSLFHPIDSGRFQFDQELKLE